MLLLVSTSDKIRVSSSVAVPLDVHASFMDYNGSAVTPGRQNTAISTATTADVVNVPGSGVFRTVKTLTARNKSATTSTVVTVIHTDGTTAIELYSAIVPPGGELQFTEAGGFALSGGVLPAGPHGAAARGAGALILPSVNATALTTIAAAANRFEASPYIPARDQPIDELALEVTTLAAGTTFHLGIYADNGAAAPGSLLVGSSAALDSATTGYKTTSVSITLQAGTLYWLVCLTSGAPTCRAVPLGGAYTFSAPAAGVTGQFTVQRGTFTFAALPSTAPACAPNTSTPPAVRLRLAA